MSTARDAIVPWLAGAWQSWVQRVASDRIPHGVLVAGPAGLGKRAFAAALAAGLLCTARDADGFACGKCRGCRLREAGTHPDLHVVTFELNDKGVPRTQILVDQVRELSTKLVQTSQLGGWRVAVVDPVDGLNDQAANALLKTLEEPEPNAVIVLVSDSPMALKATIRSRCQRIDARFPPRATAREWLLARGLDAALADASLDLAAGNPGAALALAGKPERALAQEVARDLAGIAGGSVRAAEAAARWTKDQAELRLVLAAQAVRLAAWQRARGGGEALGLTVPGDLHKLAAWWDRANQVREQLATPLRADLMLLDLLREWRALAAPPAR
ncbi:MAG TPA: DNA polymerase III subunit delta' [Xanthomonadales bacterium]|nr:DNA polymerase III subunit delta' [Xanthomonadales bacterium]